ncbi:galectin-8 isoform X4 [Ovis aries]|uniref:galectin-8 isoform X4 n=1 Tax=Ovis aries TaxID=9940 RepID=UPI00295286F8|nr:galectin-8 isoform X4 [Ovis aries]XP_060262863.1 galectin-8 isoform X4 [Ovis aries]
MMSLNNLQNVIYNPVIPYVGTISEQLEPGTLIVLRGHVPSDSDRFQVDLQCGSSVKPRADVAFHFNPRFKRANCIVCNTLRNEKWGWEEITYDMPFKKEKSFEIVIMVLKEKFQVAVNGKHTLLYAHRISPERIDTLGIYGKVIIHSVGFSFSSDLGSTQGSTLEQTGISKENVQKSGGSQLTLPFVARLNSSMGPGRTVVIKGEVNTNAKGFNVDLLSGKSKDIALHLNPRLNVKAFVRNSFLQEAWGEEERNITCFPFSPGMYFEVRCLSFLKTVQENNPGGRGRINCPSWASLIAQLVRLHLQCRRPWFNSWVGKIHWRRDRLPTPVFLGFPGGSAGKEPFCSVGDLGWIPGLERSPGEGKATHSSILAWKIPWTDSPRGQKKSDTTERLSLFKSSTAYYVELVCGFV